MKIRIVIPVIVIIVLIAVLYMYFSEKQCNQAAIELVSGYAKNYDGSGINISDDKYIVGMETLKIDATDGQEGAREKLEEAMNASVEKHRAELKAIINNNDVDELIKLQRKHYQNGDLVNEKAKLNFILIPKVTMKNNSGLTITPGSLNLTSNCEMSVDFELYIDREVEEEIKNQIITIIIKHIHTSTINPAKLDMCEILKQLENNKSLKEEIDDFCQEHEELLSILSNKEFNRDCSEDIFFFIGEYTLSTIQSAIIKKYAKIVENYITTHPDKQYELICRGYTDDKKILHPGIPRQENASIYYSNSFGQIDYKAPSQNMSLIKSHIKDNIQLSYMRSYNGIKELANVIAKNELTSLKGINLYYEGKGDKDSKPEKQCDRRIEFHLKELN